MSTSPNDVTITEPTKEGSISDTKSETDSNVIKSNGSVAFEDNIQDESLLCGWYSYRPNWLQYFNTAAWMTASVGSVMFFQGLTVNGFVVINLSTIETRYGLPSTATGLIVSTYDFTVLVLILFVSYFGASRSQSKMLGIGAMIIGCGSLVFTIPQFTTGLYEYDTGYGDEVTLCRPGSNSTSSTDCDEEWNSLAYYFIVFILGQILHGIGASPLYTIGYSYVDENVTHGRSAWYIGILNALSVFGPCTGFLVGALLLTIYVDPLAEDVTITPSDPSWVGAWWIGYLIAWICLWIVAIPMGSFPPELPETKNIERKQTAHHSESAELLASRAGFGRGWKDMWPATKVLLTNPAFILICLAKALLMFVLGGYTPFVPKFIENQFGVTSSAAAIILAMTSIPGAAGGTLLGGYVVKKGGLGVKGTSIFSFTICIITTACVPIFLLKCPEQQVAGVIAPYDPAGESMTIGLETVNLTHACNVGCSCAGTETYSPVCGVDGLVYFDACYAGCLTTPDEGETYYDCSCIDAGVTGEPEAIAGKCHEDCWQLPLFIVVFFIIMLCGFMMMAPMTILTLRCVLSSQRAYALGISSIFYRLLGSVPGPIVIGILIDSSCLIWQEVCDNTGSCWIYDNDQFGLKFTVVGLVGLGITAFLFLAVILVYKPPPETPSTSDEKATGSMSQMEEETNKATIQREVSTVSLLGYTKNDPDNLSMNVTDPI
ncbi:solute carrier organic anion transporter family member 4C1-like [Glandiceps talaboti]